MASIIRDASLAPQGRQKIEWARRHMAVLDGIAQDLKRDRPLEGLKVAVSIHLEAKTAYLAQVLHQGGAPTSLRRAAIPSPPRTTYALRSAKAA